jgi:hypothetical protein
MKLMLTILLLTITFEVFAPTDTRLTIAEGVRIDPFKPVKYAVGMVESELDTLAYNPIERATGYFQITPIRLRDYNERTKSNFVLSDMFDYAKAETVFMYYAHGFGVYRIDDAILDWNCRSQKYLKRVKNHLNQ